MVKFGPVTPSSCRDFSRKLLIQWVTAVCICCFVLFVTYHPSLKFLESYLNSDLIFLGSFVFLFTTSKTYSDRLAAVFSDGTQISRVAVFGLLYFPIVNLYFLFLCFKTKQSINSLPMLLKKGWYVFIGCIVMAVVQPIFLGFVPVHPVVLQVSRLVNPPFVHFINSTALEGRWTLGLKERLERNESQVKDEIDRFNSYAPMTSTGYILSTAVIGENVLQKKKVHKDPSKASLEMAKQSLMISRELFDNRHLILKFSPILIVSIPSIFEMGFLNFDELEIISTFQNSFLGKVENLLAKTKSRGLKEQNTRLDIAKEIKSLETELSAMKLLVKARDVPESE